MKQDGIYVVIGGKLTEIEKELPDYCHVKINVKDGKVVHATAEESLNIKQA